MTAGEVETLARMIQAEAEEEPLEGKVAVGAVIINRLRHPDFPDTLMEVLTQEDQFEPMSNGRFAGIDKANDECLEAARQAVYGKDPTGGALFFYNHRKSYSPWLKNKEVKTALGNHVFLA